MSRAFPHCKFCYGQGCLACPSEAEKYREEMMQPIFTAREGENFEDDLRLLKDAIGRTALESEYEKAGGDMEKFTNAISLRLAMARLAQISRDNAQDNQKQEEQS